MCCVKVYAVVVFVGNTYKLCADSHTKAVEWCRSLDMASRVSSTEQVCDPPALLSIILCDFAV